MKYLILLCALSFTIYTIMDIIDYYQDYYNVNCKLTNKQISLIKMLSLILGAIFGITLISILVIKVFGFAQGELQ